MIHPEMEIQWMDVRNQRVYVVPVFSLFAHFSDRIEDKGNGNLSISFQLGEVKITDWRGWTDVLLIRKVQKPQEEDFWDQIDIGNQKVLVSRDTKLPVYMDIEPRKGFHGASVYNFELKTPIEIYKSRYCMRIRRGMFRNGCPTEFHPVKVSSTDMPEEDFGYDIITKSMFFNANNVHLFGSDIIPDRMEVSR